MYSKSNTFFKGVIDVMPLMIPVVPFGIIFGAIGIELGFGPYLTYATSVIIFSGASQIVILQLFSAGASSLVAITSSSVVSTRHLLYGAVVSQHLNHLSIYWKIGLSYLLTDQAFAVSNEYFKKNNDNIFKHYYLVGSGFTLWFIWQLTTIIGIFLGSIVPEELGLTFTIPLTFLALLVNYLRKIDHLIVIILSGISSIVFFDAPFKAYIILSSIIALIGATILIKIKKKMSIWFSIIIAGLINYLTRLVSVLAINPKKMSERTKKILTYVPSAVFPAIIFPAVFLNQENQLTQLNDPKVIAILISFIIGIITKNLIITILAGLITFWTIIFLI